MSVIFDYRCLTGCTWTGYARGRGETPVEDHQGERPREGWCDRRNEKEVEGSTRRMGDRGRGPEDVNEKDDTLSEKPMYIGGPQEGVKEGVRRME